MSIFNPLLSGKQLKVAIAEVQIQYKSQRLNFRCSLYNIQEIADMHLYPLLVKKKSLYMLPSIDNLIGYDPDNSGNWTGVIGQMQRQVI